MPERNQDTISIYTSSGSTSCALHFNEGDTWLIFANGRKVPSASSCGNSRVQNNADAEKEINQIMHFLDSLQTGNHSVHEKIDGIGADYELIGEIENGQPNGKWAKISAPDTIAWLNFRNGVQYGRQIDRSLPGGGGEERDIDYRNGEKFETWRMYGQDQKMMVLMQYKDGISHGLFETQYRNWRETGQFIDGKKEGEWIYYSAGKVVSRKIYADDELQESVKYDQDGNVIKE